ncbi:hypothetical protein GOP47_0022200 [Adiantum capillus-veneris]|uniref:Uncharacterized protein n=1 Tax=Adiantum capillus-veneris TaxID=13818 RepID=A0A9D4Z5Y5_ADICA|nr:hypothetical protein GOP47_0022200 [Adiantum capillus-veneris]
MPPRFAFPNCPSLVSFKACPLFSSLASVALDLIALLDLATLSLQIAPPSPALIPCDLAFSYSAPSSLSSSLFVFWNLLPSCRSSPFSFLRSRHLQPLQIACPLPFSARLHPPLTSSRKHGPCFPFFTLWPLCTP